LFKHTVKQTQVI